MPKLSLISLLLQGIPESMALGAIVLVFARSRTPLKKLLLIGVLQGATAYAVRLLPISFGIHGIVLIVTLAIYCRFFGGISVLNALKGAILAFLCLIVAEMGFQSLLYKVVHTSLREIFQNPFLMAVSGLPQVVLLSLIALVKGSLNRRSRQVDAALSRIEKV